MKPWVAMAVIAACASGCRPQPFRVYNFGSSGLVLAPTTKVVNDMVLVTIRYRPATATAESQCDSSFGLAKLAVRSRGSDRELVLSVRVVDTADFTISLARDVRRTFVEAVRCGADDAVWLALARRLPTPVFASTGAVKLHAGMRLRIERGSGILLGTFGAMAGVGTSFANIVDDRDDALLFEEFARVRNVSTGTNPNTNGISLATIPIDVNTSDAVEKYREWRLLLPPQLTDVATTLDRTLNRGTTILLFGGNDVDSLDAYTFSKKARPCPHDTRCVGFPSHTYITPEVPVLINGKLEYLGLGTTLGDVIRRSVSTADLSPKELSEYFCSRLQISRRFGTELREIAIDFEPRASWRHLMLTHGDVIKW